MRGKQRYINTSFWDDTWVVELDTEPKLLFLYLLTNTLTNIAGIYEIGLRRMVFDTGLSEAKIKNILKAFERVGKVYFLEECNYIIMKNFMKHQKMNPNMKKGVEVVIKSLPLQVLELLSIEKSEGFESLSKALNYLNSNSNSNSNLNSNTNRGDEEEKDEPNIFSEESVESLEDSFNRWWIRYGKKGNRKKSFERWSRLKDIQREKCFEVVDQYVKSTPDKQYRKGGESYLHLEAFEDEIIESGNNEVSSSLPDITVSQNQGDIEKFSDKL